MLGQRIVTAVVLLALLIPALLSTAVWPFTVLTLVFIVAAAWEWARLNGLHGMAAYGLAVLACGLCGLTWALAPGVLPGFWWIVAAAWVTGGAWALRVGAEGWKRSVLPIRSLMGALLLWVAWWALVQARDMGLGFLMSVFVTVWVADIAAYFGGRAIGGPKLAPHISPGKTWAGALSGVAAVLLLAVGWTHMATSWAGLQGSLFQELVIRWGLVGGTMALVLVVAMSIVGDLFESLVKRAAGAKDSSGLLPGHGGVLDRIDALLPVFPLALALVS
jgi:phosphatidate cytidylyltransferase